MSKVVSWGYKYLQSKWFFLRHFIQEKERSDEIIQDIDNERSKAQDQIIELDEKLDNAMIEIAPLKIFWDDQRAK